MRALPGMRSRTAGLDKPARTTRASAAAAQHERILRAGAELVAERGYGDVSVELMIKRARVSPKTFYTHFPNKTAVFTELFETTFAHYERTIAAAIDSREEWTDRVLAVLRAFLAEIVADPVLAHAILVEAPSAGSGFLGRYEAALRAFAALLREGRALCRSAEELPQTLEETIAGSLLWAVYQRLIAGEVDQIELLLPSLAELVFRPYLGDVEARRLALGAGTALAHS